MKQVEQISVNLKMFVLLNQKPKHSIAKDTRDLEFMSLCLGELFIIHMNLLLIYVLLFEKIENKFKTDRSGFTVEKCAFLCRIRRWYNLMFCTC